MEQQPRIILLSGGSGTRLWPLSNGTRAKQFLQLLPAPDGTTESMLQRIVRQLREAGLGDPITVATSLAQRDIVCNQLDEQVSFITEPDHRGTLPAICLAALRMAESGVGADETVVVMPTDAFAGADYFRVMARMAAAVPTAQDSIVLMGVRPTYPSTKYGYIVPTAAQYEPEAVLPVAKFVEKPALPAAEVLFGSGALWNGGVFAMRLGYLLEVAARTFGHPTYDSLYTRYATLPKLSFDIEVLEKAERMLVVPFLGQWKDLGTWNTLLEETPVTTSGNVLVGQDVEHTHIINELDQPLLCVGTHGMIVAATSDGILVCRKELSESIKHDVGKLAVRPMYEERRWGTYKVINNLTFADGAKALTKLLCIKAGKNISYQIHRHRDEIWTFVDGEGRLVLDGREQRVGRGDVVRIAAGTLHAVRAISDLQIIEVQTGDQLVEEDIERFPWSWEC